MATGNNRAFYTVVDIGRTCFVFLPVEDVDVTYYPRDRPYTSTLTMELMDEFMPQIQPDGQARFGDIGDIKLKLRLKGLARAYLNFELRKFGERVTGQDVVITNEIKLNHNLNVFNPPQSLGNVRDLLGFQDNDSPEFVVIRAILWHKSGQQKALVALKDAFVTKRGDTNEWVEKLRDWSKEQVKRRQREQEEMDNYYKAERELRLQK